MWGHVVRPEVLVGEELVVRPAGGGWVTHEGKNLWLVSSFHVDVMAADSWIRKGLSQSVVS